jgi:hypothetical protein
MAENGKKGLLKPGSRSPRRQKLAHYTLAALWLCFAAPVILVPGWKYSVTLLVFISIYANVAGHWSAGQAAAAEEHADK